LLRLVPAPAIPGSPDSEIEEVLADLWRDAFDRDDVDVEQPFLTAGGDSLAATVIAAGIHDIFGIELGLGIFAGDPTVSELARLINDQRATGVVTVLHEIEKVPRRGSHPLSSSQLGTWTRLSAPPAAACSCLVIGASEPAKARVLSVMPLMPCPEPPPP